MVARSLRRRLMNAALSNGWAGVSLISPIGVTSASTVSPSRNPAAARAREIVLEIERRLGLDPVDRETEKLGYDIESRIPGTGRLRFIEVKGRIAGAATITVTKNEILYSLNKPDDFILAIVEFEGDNHRVVYLRRPFQREPDFGASTMSSIGPNTRLMPNRVSSDPAVLPAASANSGFHVAPRAMLLGTAV